MLHSFSLLLGSTLACAPTNCHNDATTASFLVPSVISTSLSLGLTRACLLTNSRNNITTVLLLVPSLVSSSFLHVLLSLDPPPFPFLLLFTPRRARPLTHYCNDTTTALLLPPSVVSTLLSFLHTQACLLIDSCSDISSWFFDVLLLLNPLPPPLPPPCGRVHTLDCLHLLFCHFISLVLSRVSSSLPVSSVPLRSGLRLFVTLPHFSQTSSTIFIPLGRLWRHCYPHQSHSSPLPCLDLSVFPLVSIEALQ